MFVNILPSFAWRQSIFRILLFPRVRPEHDDWYRVHPFWGIGQFQLTSWVLDWLLFVRPDAEKNVYYEGYKSKKDKGKINVETHKQIAYFVIMKNYLQHFAKIYCEVCFWKSQFQLTNFFVHPFPMLKSRKLVSENNRGTRERKASSSKSETMTTMSV